MARALIGASPRRRSRLNFSAGTDHELSLSVPAGWVDAALKLHVGSSDGNAAIEGVRKIHNVVACVSMDTRRDQQLGRGGLHYFLRRRRRSRLC